MKILNITINKAKVLDNVSLATAYTGVKNGSETGFYERVSTVSEDDKLLERFWKESIGEITDKLRPFIQVCRSGGEELELIMEVSNSYDDALTETIKEDLKGSLTAGITARWFQITFPEKAREMEEQARVLAGRVYANLYYRKRPRR